MKAGEKGLPGGTVSQGSVEIYDDAFERWAGQAKLTPLRNSQI